MVGVALCVKIAVEVHGVVAMVYYIQEQGWEYDKFSQALGALGIFSLLGCFLGGFLADKTWPGARSERPHFPSGGIRLCPDLRAG